MSMRFDLPSGATLRVVTRRGHVDVTAEDREDVAVETTGALEAKTAVDGKTLILDGRRSSARLEVRCPTGTSVSIGTISGHVSLSGVFGSVGVATTSGSVRVDRATRVDLRSVSGDLSVVSCDDRCHLLTASGRIIAEATGSADVCSASGAVRLGRAAGPVSICTVSGQVELGASGKDGVAVRTVSGAIKVKVPQGRQPSAHLRSVSGRVRCDCPEGTDFDLNAASFSGAIEVESP